MAAPPDTIAALRRATLALAAALAAALAFTWWAGRRVTPSPFFVETGQASVSAPFRLTDQDGRLVTDRDFLGQTLVIYFGWRLDPDLTPAALQVLTAALRQLGPKSDGIVPVFISLDADRDQPHAISEFLAKSGYSARGLVGSAEAIRALSRAVRLYWKTLPDSTLPGGYSIDHASLYYVFGVDGAFRGVVPHTTDVATLANELLRLRH